MIRKQDESFVQERSLEGIDNRVYSNIDAVGKSLSELGSKENRLCSNIDDIDISLSGIYLNCPIRTVFFIRYMLDLPAHLCSLLRALVDHWAPLNTNQSSKVFYQVARFRCLMTTLFYYDNMSCIMPCACFRITEDACIRSPYIYYVP